MFPLPREDITESVHKGATDFEKSNSSSLVLVSSPTGSEPPHKLEKKVTFARLLNKVSAEMSSGSERDQREARERDAPASGPGGPSHSPAHSQHSQRSHSTSSNLGTGTGSDSLSSLDVSAGQYGGRLGQARAGQPTPPQQPSPSRPL